MEPAKTIEYKGYKIELHADSNYDSPNDWDTGDAYLVHYHNQFWMENKGVIDQEDLKSIYRHSASKDYELTERAKDILTEWWCFPVSAYIHSGVALSLGNSFACDSQGWDTSHVGALFMNKKANNRWRWKKYAFEDAFGIITTWNQYLSGEIYGYKIIDPDGEEKDSCWSIYSLEECTNQAKSAIDNIVQ